MTAYKLTPVTLLSLCALGTLGFWRPMSAKAMVAMRPILPSMVAFRAAELAVAACKQQGYGVTATVVNTDGILVAALRGDDATPHTIENSFNKAYTTITLGPIFKVDSSEKIKDEFEDQHRKGVGSWALPADPIKGISFNIGGIALYANHQLVGAIGVSGTPDGHIDQSCAKVGKEAAEKLLQ